MEGYIREREEEKQELQQEFEKDYNRYKEITQRSFSAR